MKRLLQIGVLLLGVATVLLPLLEFFDRWDPPGPPMNDTELGAFAFILVLALILLVAYSIAALHRLVAKHTVLCARPFFSITAETGVVLFFAVVPHSSPPLRI